MQRLYFKPESIDFKTANLRERPEPGEILMCSPQYFNVTHAINPFMTDDAGELHKVDVGLAFQQWTTIRFFYDALGYKVHALRAEAGLEDMVFSANQSFPYIDWKTGDKSVIMSVMRKDKRKGEVPYYQSWYRKNGYTIHHLKDCCFESNGDTLWYPGKYLLISGYGSTEYHRTDRHAIEQVAKLIDCPVVGIELTHPDFYHLNTTLAIIDENTAIVYPPGVGKDGMKTLESLFSDLIITSREETYAPHFACNAFAIKPDVVFIQNSATHTIRELEKRGRRVIGVDTSEFIKSGGSVFCMKIKVY